MSSRSGLKTMLLLAVLACMMLGGGRVLMAQNDITIPATDTISETINPFADYIIYDPGGVRNYPANCSGVLLLVSASGMPIQIQGSFDMERNKDGLYIYDGQGDSCPMVINCTNTGTVNVTCQSGYAYLVFYSNGSNHRPGFALTACTCMPTGVPITNITATNITGSQARISWRDTTDATQWTVAYGTDPYNLSNSVMVGSCRVLLRDLDPVTTYYFRVYNNLGATPAHGICAAPINTFSTICPSNAAECVNFTDLNSCHTVCRYGSFGNPDASIGVVDNGYTNANSRHTVHTNTAEYDARTGRTDDTRLRTVPPGEIASVRLGNWKGGGQGESITYEYFVDTAAYDLLVLKYAAVLQQPGHSQNEQPRFDFAIYDENNNKINSDCYSAVFIPGYTRSSWHEYNGVSWKDWTTVGIDLSPLHGQKIYIKLTTKDCVFSAHYGYAYFTLTCDHRTLTSSSCGFSIANTFTAPDGFSYRWYNDTLPSATLSTGRSLSVTEEGSYTCYLSYGGGASGTAQCGFSMNAIAGPRFPYSQYTYAITDTVNCLTRVQFYNASVITSDLDHQVSTGLSCERYQWIVDGVPRSTDVNPYFDFAEGWHDVQLVAMLSEGICTDTATEHFYIGAACWVFDTLRYFFCDSGSVRLFDTVITSVGSYTRDSANHTHTVIYTLGYTTYRLYLDSVTEDSLPYLTFNEASFDTDVVDSLFVLTNVGGCDSLISYNLFVCRNLDTVLSRVECDDVLPLRWFDGEFRQADTQHFHYYRYCHADSNVTLQVAINPTYSPQFYDTICDNFYSERSGYYFNVTGKHRVRLESIDGCDSSEYLNLLVYPTYDIIDHQVICSYDSLLWQDGNVYRRSTHFPLVTYPTIHQCDSNVTLELIVEEPVVAKIGQYPNSASHAQREVTLTDYSLRSSTREWYLDGEFYSLDAETYFFYPVNKASVLVMLVAIDTLGCVDTAYRTVLMDRECVWMPNVLTPELPSNNVLRVQAHDIDKFECYIYNRNGHFLYKFKSIDDVWDCTYRGQKCPQGTYVYLINYTPKYNPKSWYTLKGTFTIIR